MTSLRTSLSILLIGLVALLAGGCSAVDDTVPVGTIERLNGEWQQADGHGHLRFYPDQSVKLTLPDDTPPLKVLSTVEAMKDNKIGFSIGDRWTAPVRINPAADWQSLDLVLPGEKSPKDERTIHFIRSKP